LLATSRDGCTEAIILAHGFTVEMLVETRARRARYRESMKPITRLTMALLLGGVVGLVSRTARPGKMGMLNA
jgi:hypothetical protein